MRDYSEVTATIPARIGKLQNVLSKREYIEASCILVELLADLAMVLYFCKTKIKE